MDVYEQFTPYVHLGVLILLSAVALIILASIAKGLFWDKGEPKQIFVADKEPAILFDIKKIKIAWTDPNSGAGSVFLFVLI